MRDVILSTAIVVLGVLLLTGIVAHMIYFMFVGIQFFAELFSKIGAAIGSLL